MRRGPDGSAGAEGLIGPRLDLQNDVDLVPTADPAGVRWADNLTSRSPDRPANDSTCNRDNQSEESR